MSIPQKWEQRLDAMARERRALALKKIAVALLWAVALLALVAVLT